MKNSLLGFQAKGISKEECAARSDLILALPERIQSIPDGAAGVVKQTSRWSASASSSYSEIKLDSTWGNSFLFLNLHFYFFFFNFLVSNSSQTVIVRASIFSTRKNPSSLGKNTRCEG